MAIKVVAKLTYLVAIIGGQLAMLQPGYHPLSDLRKTKFHLVNGINARSPASQQETFWSPASRLSLALKSPANRLAGDLKVSCQPAIGILINKEIAF